MELARTQKYSDSALHRTISPEETFRRIQPLLAVLGITRLADITGLDRLGIPTYSAVVPDSPDVLSVYNGKGASRIDARVGAIMEAAERHAGWRLHPDVLMGSFSSLSCARPVLDPTDLILELHPDYSHDQEIGWVEGVELGSDDPVLVPAQAVGILFDQRHGHPCYSFSTTNGLASGNSLEEAICHALCEIIERDAWTLAELMAIYFPRIAAQRRARGEPSHTNEAVAHLDRHPALDLASGPPAVRELATKFENAGVSLLVRDITSDVGIPVVLASATEDLAGSHAFAHFGLGAHPDATIAVVRALTEVAQCRAVDIQAVREDIAPPESEQQHFAPHTKRRAQVEKQGWYFSTSGPVRSFDTMASINNREVVQDIELLRGALRQSGMDRVIVVDLTVPDVGIPCVRVLVPGAESWAADHGRLGWRATQAWRQSGGGSQLTPSEPTGA
jgi:ribosomal protein S12 methylthiotransferase accessory factor